jgi:ATP-dependent RNA helicase RhlE
MSQALVFTRTKHRANRLADSLVRCGINAERIHGNRSQTQRTQALAGFKSGRYPVLVATDIAARGIDVEDLSHVINFDVPAAPDDYIHRVGRTGRAEMTGEAFTFVSPEEEADLQAIERALGVRLPRVTLPDFDYKAQAPALEVPLRDRIAAIRQQKRGERERATLNAARRAAGARGAAPHHAPRPDGSRGSRPHGARGPGGPASGRFRPRGPRRRPS